MGNRYAQLSLSERVYIQSQLELGFKAAAIAAALKRRPSTIGRELRRNGWRRSARSHPALAGRPRPPHGYRADRAQQRADAKAALPRVPRRLVPGTPLWEMVVDNLRASLSPEQIAGTLKRMAPALAPVSKAFILQLVKEGALPWISEMRQSIRRHHCKHLPTCCL